MQLESLPADTAMAAPADAELTSAGTGKPDQALTNPNDSLSNKAPEAMTTGELLKSLVADGGRLFEQQVKLLRLESRRQTSQEKASLGWWAVAGLVAVGGLATLLIAAVMALALRLGGRYDLAALIIGGGLLILAVPLGVLAWNKRVRVALPASRAEFAREIEWLKKKTR